MWPPIRVKIFVYYGFRSYGIIAVLDIPALNKSIKKRNRRFRIRAYRLVEVATGFFSGNSNNTHPVATWRKLFGAKHQMPRHIQLKWIVVPEIGNKRLLRG